MELSGLSELTLQSIGFRIVVMLILSSILGSIIAGTVFLLGDKGPKYDGRLSVGPFSHVDLLGGISLIGFGYGWSKSVVMDAQQFSIGRVGVLVVILAGFFGLLLTAAIFHALKLPALTTLPYTAGLAMSAFLRAASELSIKFALFSLIPFPPLTAGLLLHALNIRIPQAVQTVFIVLLFIALATGLIRQILDPAFRMLASIILGM
jgi:hypothetical protein